MTAFANGEVVIAESALAIVTRRATLRAPGRVMIQWFRCRNLTSLRQAGANLMTIFTVSLWIMLRMAESKPEGGHVLRGARIAAELMTSAARRNVAPVRLRARRVTTETSCVRIEVRRNCHGDPAAHRTMTSGAVDAAQRQVLCMIELHAEAD